MADASIYNALRQPPKSSLEYAAEYGALGDQMAKRRQNALLMKQQQQEYDDDQAVRAALSRVAPDAPLEARVGALRATGLPGGFKAADALEAARLKADQDKAGLLKTQAETEKIKADKAKLIHGEIKGSLGFVLANPTPEAAESAISRIESMFGIDGTQYRNEVARLRTPEDFKMWAAGHSIDADKQLTTFTTRNTGGSTDTLAQNPILGTVTVANSVKNTQSPDSVASTAVQRRGQDINASIARERLNFDRGQANAGVYDPERGILINKTTGQAIPVYQGGQALGPKDKPLNDTQSKALLFGSRMQEAEKVLANLAKEGVNKPGLIKSAAESIPLVGGGIGSSLNFTQSDQQQGVEQAKRDFINAALRRESGAAIAASEYDSADKQYFPQIGDSDAVIKQKARNRQLAIRGILAEVPQGKQFGGDQSPSNQSGRVKVYNPATGKIE